ncbi:hypothetical protein LC612_37135 [Nostoc sp. CHAB 5834]|nr:hypothetical protein [Nostoc sp. CHAB 5834]
MINRAALLTVVLLAFSCTGKKPEGQFNLVQNVPDTYHLKSSPVVSFTNDIVHVNSKPYTGFMYELSPAGDTLLIEGYINGLLTGYCKKNYPSGQRMEERWYKSGRKNGLQLAYWPNGKKRFEFVAKDDAYEGELKEWTINGHLFHLAHYKNGQEEGIQKLWYDNGKIRANYVIVQGKRYGLLGTKNCKNVSDSIFAVR